MRTSQSSVPIVGLPSLSVLRSRSFSNPGAILMSPSAAPHAARQESQNDTEVAATTAVPVAKCFRQHAPSVAKPLKYPLNLAVISRFTVVIATVKLD